jgi:hypothetical protein
VAVDDLLEAVGGDVVADGGVGHHRILARAA